MRPRGFTLIELLVVIAIIGILVSLAFPMLGKVSDNRKFAKSQSNLRQIGIALLQHANENNGNFPTAHGSIPYPVNTTNLNEQSWQQQLDIYLGINPVGTGVKTNDPTRLANQKIFISEWAAKYYPNSKKWGFFLGSHAAGAEALANHEANFFVPVNLNKIQYPAKHILAGEAHGGSFAADDGDKDDYNQNNPAFAYSGQSRRVNILFADGHVDTFTNFSTNMSVLYSGPTNDPGYQ